MSKLFTSLDLLDRRFKPSAVFLLDRALEKKIPLRVINTLRTPDQQAENIVKGVSWTKHSLHLPQQPEGLSLAIDVCPVEYLVIKNWNPTGLYWHEIGLIGEALGLRWGGRWKQVDLGHFEYVIGETTHVA